MTQQVPNFLETKSWFISISIYTKTFMKAKHIHFSGICGTAMASLASLLKKRGYHITGSDEQVYPPMSTFLESEGIAIQKAFDAKNLSPAPDQVVIGNALSRGNAEVEAALSQGIPFISMAELLKEYFIQGRKSLVVTGTHGKTTTTSLLTWVFHHSKKDPGFLIGGIAENLNTSCAEGAGEYFITEGDEYDTAFFDKRSKFFHYLPQQLILNNIEFDHADIFDSLEVILKAFRLLLRLVPQNGLIVANGDDDRVLDVIQSSFSPCVTFGLGKHCDARATKIHTTESETCFHFSWEKFGEYDFYLPLMGEYNVRNALGVIILALHNGIGFDAIQNAFEDFKGIRRRQELRGIRHGISVYDDFAHHPTAVRETLAAIRQRYPKQRLIAVFEPRSNTSVLKIHQKALIDALKSADEVILGKVHRKERVDVKLRIDLEEIILELNNEELPAYAIEEVDAIIEHLKAHTASGDVILVMSNGKFGNIHQRLLDEL